MKRNITMKFNTYTKMTLLSLMIIAHSRAMAPLEPAQEATGPLIIGGGVGVEGEGLYGGIEPSILKVQPKSLEQQSISKTADQIIAGRMTLQEAKEKLPASVYEKVENEVRYKKIFQTGMKLPANMP